MGDVLCGGQCYFETLKEQDLLSKHESPGTGVGIPEIYIDKDHMYGEQR